jgi:hypothetical protein
VGELDLAISDYSMALELDMKTTGKNASKTQGDLLSNDGSDNY